MHGRQIGVYHVVKFLEKGLEMAEKRQRKPANIPKDLAEQVQVVAQKERRNYTAQVIVFVEEGLANRQSRASAKEMVSKLYDLPLEELADLCAIATELLRQRVKRQNIEAVVTKVPGNAIAKLVKKHKSTCGELFAEVDDGVRVLEKIIEGEKPDEELIPLLAACLPVTQEKLIELYNKEFGRIDAQGNFSEGCTGGCRE